jgi:hypothetical protein
MIVMLDSTTRRTFIVRSSVFLSALVVSPRTRWFWHAPFTVRIGVVEPSMSREHQMGVELGLDEARHAAALFGGTIVDVPLRSPDTNLRSLSAIIGGGDEASSIAWTHHAAESSTTYVNVGCTSDRLRNDACSRAAFHIAPSDAMSRDALAIGGAPAKSRVEAWDASLSRFGADTLNQRFLTRFHAPMMSGAWAAWFAVKTIWESALRQKSGDASRIAEYLGRETTQFDGHKGAPLSFRSSDHQLRQPLYIVSSAGGTPKQVPEIAGDESVRDALDRLGGSKSASTCQTGHE